MKDANASLVLTEPQQADATWIAQALHRSGVIEAGSVVSVQAEPAQVRSCSRMTRLAVRYREPGMGPTRLLLKLCGSEAVPFGRSEVDYYRRDYADAVDPPLPRCFDAAYADATRCYHLLLEDLSASHGTGDDAAPDEAFSVSFAASLAALHAHRAGSDRLRQIGAALPGRADIERHLGQVRQGLEPMLALMAGDERTHWAPRLRHLFDGLADRFVERAGDPRGMTLIHGDLNPGNLLVPRDGPGSVLFIDRQPFDWSLTCWLGASDLACAMVPWWDTTVRRQLEAGVLGGYHVALQRGGVSDYPPALLREDYRLCLAMAIAVPMNWCAQEADRERMRWLWTLQLQRALAAFDDPG